MISGMKDKTFTITLVGFFFRLSVEVFSDLHFDRNFIFEKKSVPYFKNAHYKNRSVEF